ncbi:MAG: hypothetical protein AB8C46_22250 [Burkholderiaceae bacterium]
MSRTLVLSRYPGARLVFYSSGVLSLSCVVIGGMSIAMPEIQAYSPRLCAILKDLTPAISLAFR